MELGFVYVISTPFYLKDNIWKIGCTKNLYERLKKLNSTRLKSDHFFIKMFWQTKHYFNLESGLHRELKKVRQNNEFFQCSYNKIEEALKIYLSKKPQDYIYDDAVLIPALKRNLKWFEKDKIFSIKENDTETASEIIINEEMFLEEVKSWIYLFGNEKFLKFAHSSFWDKYMWMLKKNFDAAAKIEYNTQETIEDISKCLSSLFLNESVDDVVDMEI